jgi:hypothetical protein
MEIKAARALCDRAADACGIDRNDNWNVYAEDFKADAKAMLDACGAPDLLKALTDLLAVASVRIDDPRIVQFDAARVAIAKATGATCPPTPGLGLSPPTRASPCAAQPANHLTQQPRPAHLFKRETMSDINTGGPAFPMGNTEAAMYARCLEDLANPTLLDGAERAHLEAKAVALCGMTLRDYFAAKAMQGMLASDVNATRHIFAAQAYAMADAMLEAREA